MARRNEILSCPRMSHLISSYQVVQVNHRFGMSVVWDVVAIEAVWHTHDSHYKLWSIWRPGCTIVLTCQHLLQPCIPCKHDFLGYLAWLHNVFTMCSQCFTLMSLVSPTWELFVERLGSLSFVKTGLPRVWRWKLRRCTTALGSVEENEEKTHYCTESSKTHQNPSKQPKLSTVPQMQAMFYHIASSWLHLGNTTAPMYLT